MANKLHFQLWPPHLLVMNINSLIWFCYLLMDERPLISKKLWIEHQQYTPRSKYTTWLKCTLGNTYELNEKTLLSSLNDKWLEIFIIQHSWFQILIYFSSCIPDAKQWLCVLSAQESSNFTFINCVLVRCWKRRHLIRN